MPVPGLVQEDYGVKQKPGKGSRVRIMCNSRYNTMVRLLRVSGIDTETIQHQHEVARWQKKGH